METSSQAEVNDCFMCAICTTWAFQGNAEISHQQDHESCETHASSAPRQLILLCVHIVDLWLHRSGVGALVRNEGNGSVDGDLKHDRNGRGGVCLGQPVHHQGIVPVLLRAEDGGLERRKLEAARDRESQRVVEVSGEVGLGKAEHAEAGPRGGGHEPGEDVVVHDADISSRRSIDHQ